MEMEMEMEMVVSRKKTEANRRNALRSSGPRTVKGENKVRWNAVQHGLLSRNLLVQSGRARESESEFKRLLGQLQRDYQPGAAVEEMLVEKIAVCRLQRQRKGARVPVPTSVMRSG